MRNRAVLEGFFYKENRDLKFILINSAILLAATLTLFMLTFSLRSPAPFAFGLALILYSFFTMGKEGGMSYSFVYLFLIIILLIPGSMQIKAPYIILLATALAFIYHFSGFIDRLDEMENRNFLTESAIEGKTVEAINKLEKTRSAIGAHQQRMEKYRILNKVADELMSILDRKSIVRILNSSISNMIGDRPVKSMLLIKNEDTDSFHPAVEEQEKEVLVKGAINIYKKDPFDEWIIKNKFTLFIKDLDDDIRFRNLRKDWINFKSLIAMPLFENKKIIGILKFYSDEPDVFDIEDVRLLNYLGDLCATAVENSILYQKTTELATRDGLTGLFIRRHFIEKLDEEVKRSRQSGTIFSYVMIDIDHFKDCNDTYGHLFGDKVLKVLGEFLRENLRDVDVIGRYGGEEFAIILPSTNMNGAKFVANRLRESFSKLIISVNENQGIKLTLSLGGVEYKSDMKLMEVINLADKALYYSKENGRNKVTFWEEMQ
jgi:diguanylate cyclase (GGDEF)-like protein